MNNGLLELITLNASLNNQGIFVGCDLRFYTRTLIYSVGFGASGSYNIEKYNRFLGYWEQVMFSGTFKQTIHTLQLFEPFLTLTEVTDLWTDVTIPPA